MIAHAIHLQLLLFSLPPAGGGAEGNLGGSPGESGGPGGTGGAGGASRGSRRPSGSSKKVNLGGDGELVLSPPSFSIIATLRGTSGSSKKVNLGRV